MSMYSKDHSVCREFVPCPMGDPMFEGCNMCGMTNHFDGNPFPMECFNCAAGYEREMWKDGGHRCVRHDMYYDCTKQDSSVAGTLYRPALPAGHPECDKCFAVGHEVSCAHCKPGFKLDHMTGNCEPEQQPGQPGGSITPVNNFVHPVDCA